MNSVKRADAEAIYAAGREAVVEALLRMDRRIEELGGHLLGDDDPAASGIRLPERLESVTLILPAGERLPARTSERQADRLGLVVSVPIAPLSDEQLASAVVEVAIPDGRALLHGTLTCPDRAAPEVLVLADTHLVSIVQQREFSRASVECPVHLVLVGQEGTTIRTHTVNLGAGGALLDGPHAVPVGSEVEFEIAVDPLAPPLRGAGRITRKDEHGRPAVAFDAMEPLDRRRLVRFVVDARLDEGFGSG